MTSMTSAAVSSRNAYIKYLRKTARALFPVFKEKGQPLADVTEKLTLQFNHELQERLQNIGISVLPAGVLEPWASGVIAYCVGTSTNQLRWFRLANRGFVVRGRLGSETSTFDASGDVVETQPYHHVSPEAVERALDRFRGHFFQDVPPPPDGGRASPVAPIQRPVVCHAIACAQLDLPDFSLEIESGPGFSPRVFVRDLGRALGSRACLTSLEQVRQGPFTLEHALPSYRWSWEEASATSRKLADLWGPCIAQVRQEMEHQRALFEGRARYY
ncbi:probable tRNA pseudouridine synthase 1 [Ixodes scapularis]|uniref:probable tRNA pseudouridine synthase 1 n=1 Tax=Ixodes scapularis TaxID=6945 RepID=UPI001C38F67C|nr:probable tRNA pseudouridine synthase 1 [Ixodes scapularis]